MTFARGCLLFLLALAGLPALAGPNIQHWRADNGARVYFVEAHQLPIVQVRVVFDAGGAKDPSGKAGLAALTNTLLKEGTGDLNADEIAIRFEGLGTEFSTGSLRDMAQAELRSLSDRDLLTPAIALFARILAGPSFPQAGLERERRRSLTALRQQRQSPGDVASKIFFKELYGAHPYAEYPGGDEAGLKAVTRADLVAFHRRYYVGANAVVAIVGDLDRSQAEEIAAQLMEGLPRGEPAPRVPPVPALPAAVERRLPFPSTQAHLLMGQPGMKRGDPDYFPLYVGNYILGGGGLVSRLAEEIREQRGLAYSAYSYFTPMRERGPFIVGLQTKNAQIDQALALARRIVTDFVAKGPTAKEVAAAKKHLTGGFPLRIDSNRKITDYLAVIGFYDLPLSYLDDFNGNVEAVTIEQIRDAFRRRIRPDRMLTVIVGGD